MVFLWYYYSFPMVMLCISMVLLMSFFVFLTYSFAMPIIFLLYFCNIPSVFLLYLYGFLCISVVG